MVDVITRRTSKDTLIYQIPVFAFDLGSVGISGQKISPHFTNCYVIYNPEIDKFLIIDPGTIASRQYLLDGLHSIIGFDMKDTEFALTHAHPDHAHLLLSAGYEHNDFPSLGIKNKTVYVHQGELGCLSNPGSPVEFDRSVEFLQALGLEPQTREELIQSLRGFKQLFAKYGSEQCVQLSHDLDELKQRFGINIIHTPGHSPGHVCYVIDDEIVLTGDLVVPFLIPQLWPRQYNGCDFGEGYGLGTYKESLDTVLQHGELRGLPAHGSKLSPHSEQGPVSKRIEAINSHYDELVESISASCQDRPQSLVELAQQHYNGKLNGKNRLLAYLNFAAVTEYMVEQGLLREIRGQPLKYRTI